MPFELGSKKAGNLSSSDGGGGGGGCEQLWESGRGRVLRGNGEQPRVSRRTVLGSHEMEGGKKEKSRFLS